MKKIFLSVIILGAMLSASTGTSAQVKKAWNFTSWSEATVANLKADNTLWSDIEKADATEPSDISAGNCFWQVTAGEDTLTANGTVIAETEGLLFTNTTNRSLAIAVDYDSTSLGTYHGASYLWLGGKNIAYFNIPKVALGSKIKMGIETHKTSTGTDGRGVTLTATGSDGTEVTITPSKVTPTAYVDTTFVVGTDDDSALDSVDVTVTNTNGCHIYYITVSDPDPVDVSVSPESGADIYAAAVEAAKGKPLNNITITLTAGSSYTQSAPIVAAGSIVVTADSTATIDASALTDAMFALSAAPAGTANSSGFYPAGPITIKNCNIKNLSQPLISDGGAQYAISAVTVAGCLISTAPEEEISSFVSLSKSGVLDLTFSNTTVYRKGSAAADYKYFVQYSNSARADRLGGDSLYLRYTNSTFYNITKSGQWGNYSGIAGKASSVFEVQSNIFVNCSSGTVARRLRGGRNSGDVTRFNLNTYRYDGADNSAGEASYDTGVILTTDPLFKYADGGDFTLGNSTDQAKYKTGDPRWIVDYTEGPKDITLNIESGDIYAAYLDSVGTGTAGNVTVNLAKEASCAISGTLTALGSIILNADSAATIDASALTAPMLALNDTTLTSWKTISEITVSNVKITGLKQSLIYSATKYYGVSNVNISNSVIEIDTTETTSVDFTKGSLALNFTVENTTVYAPTATTKSFYSSQGGQKATELNSDATQTFSIKNSDFYNIASSKNFFSHRQSGQTWLSYNLQNSIIVNSGKSDFLASLNGGQQSANPTYTVGTNSIGTLVDGTYTDLSASQYSGAVDSATTVFVTTDPLFKDADGGDFTLGNSADQAKYKIGDPRWMVDYSGVEDGVRTVETPVTVSGVSYNLSGQRVNGNYKGIVISNGRKYLVK